MTDEPRCDRCSNYLKVCGHEAPFVERIRSVQLDTSWMPHAGTAGPTNRFGKDKDVVNGSR